MSELFRHPTRWNSTGWGYLEKTDTGLYHDGIDYNYGRGYDDFGQNIFPYCKGVVRFAEFVGNGWGNMIWIEHTQKVDPEDAQAFLMMLPQYESAFNEDKTEIKFWARYGHLKSIRVKVGDEVTIEDVIGELGGTGSDPNKQDWSPHLHGTLYRGKPKRWEEYVVGLSRDEVQELTYDPHAFIDVAMSVFEVVVDIPEWLEPAYKWAKEERILEDWTEPFKPMSQARIAAMLYKFDQYLEEKYKQT